MSSGVDQVFVGDGVAREASGGYGVEVFGSDHACVGGLIDTFCAVFGVFVVSGDVFGSVVVMDLDPVLGFSVAGFA